MSDDIEELVSNLTLAVKNTLEPYVKKLNMDKERNIFITNLLKSLPEYKEMEHEELLCKKCALRLDDSPKIIPCGETICSTCSESIQINNKTS